MSNKITGIHHITAIAGNAKRNVDFYMRVLGLRMVKRTVNLDDMYRWSAWMHRCDCCAGWGLR
jgi:glyoxalase family protein